VIKGLQWLEFSILNSFCDPFYCDGTAFIPAGVTYPLTGLLAATDAVSVPQLAIKNAVLSTNKITLKLLISNSFDLKRCSNRAVI
jgi:hypothetical protein